MSTEFGQCCPRRELQWRESLLARRLERIKQTVNPAPYEMYHLRVVQGLLARETACALDVSTVEGM